MPEEFKGDFQLKADRQKNWVAGSGGGKGVLKGLNPTLSMYSLI